VTTLYLLVLFAGTQFFGLYITQHFQSRELPYTLEPPAITDGWSISYLVGGIIVVSVVFYLFNKLRYERFIRLWFSLAIIMSLGVSFSVFIGDVMGLIVAIVFAIIRLLTKDLYVHNFTELFIYGGVVSIFMPLFDPLSVFILLIIISVYDYVSVFMTKHMVKLAKTQASANLFSGLVIQYKDETAILGGGDVAFSLLFASVLGVTYGVVYAYFTVYAVLIAIAGLTILGRKGKFYPAMPFITVACTLSYLTVLI